MVDINKHTPSLRFPEFLNDGEWKEHTFSDVFTFVPNNTLSRANLNNENGSVQNIHYGDILIKFGEYLNVQTEHLPFISNVQDIERYSKAKLANGDVIIADTAEDETVGKCTELVGIVDEFIVSGLHTIAVRPNNTFATGYLGFYMNSNSYREQLKRVMQGVKVLSVSKTAISQTRLRFPSSRIEQGRIADCLTFLDSYIYDTKSKLQQLKAHKRGLMQRLFPTKGKTVPELRFHEFRNAGEWNNKKLGECLLQSPDYGLNSPAVPYNPLLNTYLRITDISENGRFISETKVSVDATLTDDNSLHDGDIVLARTGASVGKSYKYRKEDGNLIFAGFLIRIKPNTTKYNSEFIFQYLQTDIYRNWVNITSARSGQPGINSNEYSSLSIPFPSLNEQQKIAECLMSIDELIRLYESKVTLLDQHKKGLMQQLFPKL